MNWKVLARSSNTNSFGLNEFIFIGEDGSCARALGNYLRVKEMPVGKCFSDRGSIIDHLIHRGFECAEIKAIDPKKMKKGVELYKKVKNEPVFKQLELSF